MGWFSKKKAPPQTVEQQAVQSPHGRFTPNWAFTYEAKRLPGPGTNNYAYENLGLVEFTPIGPAERNRQQWQTVQPQVAYAGFDMWYQGLGGLSVGTIYGTPLVDPSAPYGSGVTDMEGGDLDGMG